ncbi:hypothetical protein [Stenotrophomonas pictorum]|uniref:hypothetical protein n=1 Tax=Stenotrophomonas pictorum TaxID=86184 RepID=UPI00210C5D56|nr:hypothetical protein [Stenotrophomonas pictorum]
MTTTSPATFPSLFSVVPAGIFGPLASANRQNYWALLCRLFDEFFGRMRQCRPATVFRAARSPRRSSATC